MLDAGSGGTIVVPVVMLEELLHRAEEKEAWRTAYEQQISKLAARSGVDLDGHG